jgi:Phasin protein
VAKADDNTGAETTDTARAKTRAVTKTKANEAMAKTNEGEVTETRKSDPVEIAQEPVAKTTDTQAAETTEDDAGTKTGHVIRTEGAEYSAANQTLRSNMTAASSFLHTLQAIAAEASDYSKRLLEDRTIFVAKLVGATTFESVIQLQSEHAKTSYAGFMAYVMKMTELRINLTKEFFKPIEPPTIEVQKFNHDARRPRP